MSYYNELNELYMEKVASPELQFLVRDHKRYRDALDEKFMLNDIGNPRDGVLKNVYDKQNKQIDRQRRKGAYDKYRYGNAPSQTSAPAIETKTQPLGDRVKAWNDQRIERKNQTKQLDLTQKRHEMQRLDNQRIDKEYRLQQAKKNPSFRRDTIDPKAQDQSFWAAVRGNKPQGGDRNQAITPSTSVFANPNNQSSLGARMLSWSKNNPGKAAIGAGLTTAGVAAAAYGVHRAKQLKKRRQEQQSQQIQDGMYRAASEELNVLYTEKLASADVEDIASHITDEVQDDASLIEKLQESAKYTKKEDVPGGKSSPSRLVQRKNKERFMK